MRKRMTERALIWRVVKILPDEVAIMTDEERLDLLIDLGIADRTQLIQFCTRIIMTAVDGKRIKMEQLEKRYADQLIK